MCIVNTLINTNIVFQNGQTKRNWVDGSPYAFQAWKQGAINTLDMSTYQRNYYINFDEMFEPWSNPMSTYQLNDNYHKMFEAWSNSTYAAQHHKACSQCINYIQPQAGQNVNCTAAVMADGIPEWIKVPCKKPHIYTEIICEIRKAQTLHDIPRVRSHIECPPRAIHLANTCVRVYTSVWKNLYDISSICAGQNATLYHIPRSIVAHDPLWYDGRDIFFVGFLQAMNHRWPGLVDNESALIDDLLMASVNSMERVIFRFSLTTLSHVEIGYLHNTTEGTVAVHVVCEFPLSPVNSYCFSGHFACKDGTCILENYVCDGVTDCPDNTDEVDCDHVCNFSNVNNVTGKKDCFSSCISSTCVCSDLYFHCTLGGCIPWSRVCDGVDDCPNNEDEQVCGFYYLGSSSLVNITQTNDTLYFSDGTGPFFL